MATPCPCGCGRRVGFSTKGAAVGVRFMETILETITPVIESEIHWEDPAEEREALKFLSTGKQIRQWFLDHVHKVARPGTTPDLLALKRMLDQYQEAALDLAKLSPAG